MRWERRGGGKREWKENLNRVDELGGHQAPAIWPGAGMVVMLSGSRERESREEGEGGGRRYHPISTTSFRLDCSAFPPPSSSPSALLHSPDVA